MEFEDSGTDLCVTNISKMNISSKHPYKNNQRQTSFVVKKYFILIFLLFVSYKLICQNGEITETITNIAEELATEESDPGAAALFIELLAELSENPVKINSGDESEISRLFFLSDFQIKSLRDHINKSGNIVSVFEIASIPGFDRQVTEVMMPFISLINIEKNTPEKPKFRNNLITNFLIKPGEDDTSSIGSNWKILSKYKTAFGPLSAGITIEKDAGEKFMSGNPPVPDFFSSNITWSGKGLIRQIILGDYSARFGHGTNINTRSRTVISLTSSGLMNGTNDIKPYTASDENNFLRGVAAELALRKLNIAMFCSRNKLDATIISSQDSADVSVTNFYISGLHNNPSLLKKKDAVSETLLGFNINYNFPYTRIGMTWTESTFSLPLRLTGKDPEDLYGFEGKKNGVFSVRYNSIVKKLLLSGEISSDYSFNLAFIQCLSLRPSDRLQVNFLYRDYYPGFVSFHGRGPRSSSSSGGESGILGNFTFEAAKYLFINAGYDISWFPWFKYNTSFPSIARKQEIRLRFIPGEQLNIEMSYNYRLSMSDMKNETGIAGIKEFTTRTFKGVVRYSPLENLTLITRIDYKITSDQENRGVLMCQDINFRLSHIPLGIWLRHCIYSIDNWDSRIYTYENDILYNFSIPALSGKGSRSYLMVEWRIKDIAVLRVKYGITSLIEGGSDPEEKDELKMQFKITF
jgi:hypothetical protein